MERMSRRKWHVVYTKPRAEKKVAERLEKRGVEVYCPLQTTLRQWSDRKKKVQVPVFPSYVFVKIDEYDRSIAYDDPGVIKFVSYLGVPAKLSEAEIINIESFLTDNTDFEVIACTWQPGDRVTIKSGPFVHQKGTVLNKFPKETTLLIENLHTVLRVKTNNKYIEK